MIPDNDNDQASRDDRHYHTARITVCPGCCGDKHQYQPAKQEFPHHRYRFHSIKLHNDCYSISGYVRKRLCPNDPDMYFI